MQATEPTEGVTVTYPRLNLMLSTGYHGGFLPNGFDAKSYWIHDWQSIVSAEDTARLQAAGWKRADYTYGSPEERERQRSDVYFCRSWAWDHPEIGTLSAITNGDHVSLRYYWPDGSGSDPDPDSDGDKDIFCEADVQPDYFSNPPTPETFRGVHERAAKLAVRFMLAMSADGGRKGTLRSLYERLQVQREEDAS